MARLLLRNAVSRRFGGFRPRLLLVVAGIALVGALLVGRAFQLQVLQHDQLGRMAVRQSQRTLHIKGRRGPILDAEGHRLAFSVQAQSVYARPGLIENPSETAFRLARLLQLPQREVDQRLRSDSSFVWIKRRVTPQEARQVAALDLEGVGFTPEYLRVYPNRDFASALLGFTGVDTQGLEGSEYAFDSYLKGAEGLKVVDRDALGRTLLSSDEDTPTGGGSVRLTLNPAIQLIAEQALERAVQSTRADVGVAIVMRSRTGEILAVAQAPAFNPNAYGDYDKELYFDRAITDGYEPGSVFKIVTASVALEEHIVTPQTAIYCEQGQFKNYDSVIHDVEPHGWLNLGGILRVSSNIGAAKVGLLVPASVFHEYLLRFGFGQRVGIFVAPDGRRLAGEADGYVPPPDKWTPVDHAAIAFGHGVLVSPLQMITAVNTIATGGLLLRPYLVQEIRDARGRVVRRDQPRVVRRVISPATAAQVRDYMEGVVEDGGTGTRAAVPGYRVAGKTGTTERYDLLARGYSKTRDIASFVGFVPADRPELTVLVLVQDPKVSRYGGQASAPVFREIIQRSLPLLGLWPDSVKRIPLGQGTAQAN